MKNKEGTLNNTNFLDFLKKILNGNIIKIY